MPFPQIGSQIIIEQGSPEDSHVMEVKNVSTDPLNLTGFMRIASAKSVFFPIPIACHSGKKPSHPGPAPQGASRLQATPKPQGLLIANRYGPPSHPKAYPKAYPRLTQGYPKATSKPPSSRNEGGRFGRKPNSRLSGLRRLTVTSRTAFKGKMSL